MASTIFTAPQYDPAKEKRRKSLILTIVLAVLVVAALAWYFRYWPQEDNACTERARVITSTLVRCTGQSLSGRVRL